MIDISVQNIVKAFEEGNNILDGITFDVNEGERVGLLGKNGAGKTTLLKIITGEIEEDEGSIVIPAARRLGFVSQIPVFPEHFLVEDVLCSAFDHLYQIKEEMERLAEQMAGGDASNETLESYDKCAHEFERQGGYTMETELARVANGLQITGEQRRQRFDTLSGGERTRINLARLILENTDILLLDEPTNHLDLNATIWLEEFLAKFKGTVVVISHDRYFLDKTISRVVEISAGKAEFYSGNYSYYVVEKQRRFEEQLERYEREQAESKRLHAAADRVQQWATGNDKLMKRAMSIRTRAEKAVKTEKPDKDREIRARFGESRFRADEVLVIKGLTKSFGGRPLLCIDELLVKGGERIAIIGDNGTGKTTLVKMIMDSAPTRKKQLSATRSNSAEQIAPDSGFARLGPSVKPAYLPQIISFEHPERSMLDTLVFELDVSPQTARNRLASYLFTGDDVFKQVGDLSGGEKSRLRLCMLMNGDINLLILDEPTNHLDLPSREWIEEALADYEETLIFISHDRYFINRFATRIWEIADGTLADFRGNYASFEASKTAQRESKTVHPAAAKSRADKSGQSAPVARAAKGKMNDKQREKESGRLEREIGILERELEEIGLKKGIYSTDYEKLLELDEQERQVTAQLDEMLEKWGQLQ